MLPARVCRRLLLSAALLITLTAAVYSATCSGDSCNTAETESSCTVAVGGASILPGQSLYRAAERTNGTKAVDLCFVVSAVHSMNESQRWLQIAVPLLEAKLLSMGIGNGSDINRYCLVQFGGRGQFLLARFLMAKGKRMYPAALFFDARRKLRKNGDVADGYEAVEFTLKNAPFREDPNIPKMVVLVTDMGRSVLALKANLTRESLHGQIQASGVHFDTIVKASMFLTDTRYRQDVVLGLNGITTATVLRAGGEFARVHGSVLFDSQAGQTVYDYIALTLHRAGSVWPLSLLDDERFAVLQSFTGAFVEAHSLRPPHPYSVCERCLCSAGEDGGVALQCTVPLFQEACRCLISRSPAQCGSLLPSPSPTTPSLTAVTSILNATPPSPTPEALAVDGRVEYTPDGDVEVFFSSSVAGTSFECLLLRDSQPRPMLASCSSPLVLKSLRPVTLRLVVLGRRLGAQGAALFPIEALPADGVLRVSASFGEANGSVLVEVSANREAAAVRFLCSLHGRDFEECVSPYLVAPAELHAGDSVFVVLALDRHGAAATALLSLPGTAEITPTPPDMTGPVMIHVTAQPPDIFGILRFDFTVSRADARDRCVCAIQVNGSSNSSMHAELCRDSFSADPRALGAGLYTLMISCQDSKNYVATSHIKFSLGPPPPIVKGPLSCSLVLRGPSDEGALHANFSCNRRVITTCQVSSRPPQPCTGAFESNLSGLEPGSHLFILTAQDGFGNSVRKVFPFKKTGLARRRCCPTILSNSSAVVLAGQPLAVNLLLFSAPGNCTRREGFSYEVDWGDTASESGSFVQLESISVSRSYSTPGDYTIRAYYCNNPALESNICCATLSLPIHLPGSS